MNARLKGMALAVFIALILTGCGLLSGTSDKEESTTNFATSQTTEEEYIKKIVSLNKKLQSNIRQLDVETASTPEKQIENTLKSLEKLVDEYRSLQPPEQYGDIQEIYLQAMDSYDQTIDILRKVLKEDNEDLWKQSKEPLEEADTYLVNAHTKLRERITPSAGETVPAEELKELDKLAGIDFEAVENNISDSGIELVGIWGRVDMEPSVILYQDGSFESYPHIQSPAGEKRIFGTWKYDKSRHTIELTTSKEDPDEKNAEHLPDRKIELKVYDFQNDEIFLADAVTLTRYHFIKFDQNTVVSGNPPMNNTSGNNEFTEIEDETEAELLNRSKWTRDDGVWKEFIQFYDFRRVIVTRYNQETRESTSWYGDFKFEKKTKIISIHVSESNEPSVNTDRLSFKLNAVTKERLELNRGNELLVYKRSKPVELIVDVGLEEENAEIENDELM